MGNLKEGGENVGFYETRDSVRKGGRGHYLGVPSFLVSPSLQNRRLQSVLNHFCFLRAQGLGKVAHCQMEPDYVSKNKIRRKLAKSFIYNFKLKSVGFLVFISTPEDLNRAVRLVRGRSGDQKLKFR